MTGEPEDDTLRKIREIREARRLPSYHDDPDEVSEVTLEKLGRARLPLPRGARAAVGWALAVFIVLSGVAALVVAWRTSAP